MSKLTITCQKRQAQYFTEDLGNGVGLDMVMIPAGSFVMGSPEEEEGSFDRERPQHTVTLPSFFMGKYPVTQAQWRVVAELPQMNRELDPAPSRFKGDDRPVENVTWYDAVEFCDRLSEKTGRNYRLPSEAEWEYACRAGTTTPFHFGETISTDLSNYRGIDWNFDDEIYSGFYGKGERGVFREVTTPVGSFKVANAFGLYDMHGNVWEWCIDHLHESYEGAPTDGSAWVTNKDGAYRIVRGGSWYLSPKNCRSALRNWNSPADGNDLIGFRPVCSIPRENQTIPVVRLSLSKLSTERGIDYTKLQDLLATGKWREADEETWNIIRQAAGREGTEYLFTTDLAQIPTADLHTIDRLWVEFSREKFGFSVQKKIWYEVNQDWQELTNRVGWRESESGLKSYVNLSFTLSAPTGHLPYQFGTPDACWVGRGLGMGSEMGPLLSRQDL